MKLTAPVSQPCFRKLLVATDFSASSRAAFDHALELCVAMGAELSVVHAFAYGEVVVADSALELIDLEFFRTEAERKVGELVEEARAAGIACAGEAIPGTAGMTILDATRERKIDLVLMGTKSCHGFERFVCGSTAETVLRHAPCPVLTVGPRVMAKGAAGVQAPVVFATDFLETTSHAVFYAEAFCKATGAPLHCLHVLPKTMETGSGTKIIPGIMMEALRHLAAEGGASVVPSVCAVSYGREISEAIAAYAKEHGAQLVVLGVRRGSMLAARLPAQVTYHLISMAPCPVLTVAFESFAEAPLTTGMTPGDERVVDALGDTLRRGAAASFVN